MSSSSNQDANESVFQRSLEQLDIISGAVFSVSVLPSIRERQTANRKIAEFRMTAPENDEKNLPKGAEDDAKTLQEIYSVTRGEASKDFLRSRQFSSIGHSLVSYFHISHYLIIRVLITS